MPKSLDVVGVFTNEERRKVANGSLDNAWPTRCLADAVDSFICAYFDEEPVARRPTSLFFSFSIFVVLLLSCVHKVDSDLSYFH